MPSIEILIAFVAAASVFAYMPGPGTLYTAAQTIARGRSAGLMATLGLHLGGYVHVIAAAAGLSMLFHAVPVMYTILKVAGAVFLVWLGIKLIVQRRDDSIPEVRVKTGRSASSKVLRLKCSTQRPPCSSWLFCRSSRTARRSYHCGRSSWCSAAS